MAGALLNKVLSFVGIYDEPEDAVDDYDDEYYENDEDGYVENNAYGGETLNSRLRNQGSGQGGGQNSGKNYGGGGRSGDGRGGPNNIVSLHPQKPPNYVLVSVKPDRMEDAQLVCDHLKERHVVIINVEGIDGREAQRIVDFIGGAVYALDGEIFDIAKRIYAVAPSFVDLVSVQRDSKTKGFSAYSSGGNYR